MRLRRRATIVALAAGIAVFAAGCSEEESGIGAGQEPKAERPPASPAPETGSAVAKASGVPKIVSPKGAPPTTVLERDLKKGTGEVARSGQTVSVNYVGALYGSGEQFDSSFGRQPLTFQLGTGGVVPGFDQAVRGMRVGGRRQVIIPPELAYGSQARGPIPANSTLIFVIDLIQAQ